MGLAAKAVAVQQGLATEAPLAARQDQSESIDPKRSYQTCPVSNRRIFAMVHMSLRELAQDLEGKGIISLGHPFRAFSGRRELVHILILHCLHYGRTA